MNAKFLLLSVSLVGFALQSSARRALEERVTLTDGQEIKIELNFGDEINLIPVEGQVLEMTGFIDVNDGENDEAYRVEFSQKGNALCINSEIREEMKPYRFVQYRDANGDVTHSSQTINIEAVFNLSVPKGHPVRIETINATLNLDLIDAPLSAKTINGEINLHLLKDSQIDLKIDTINGDCVTDLSEKEFEEISRKGGFMNNKVQYQINEGGTPVRLKTINGWMYLLSK